MPALSDWYARVAIEHLPMSALRLAPLTDDERAYYVCARSVVKKMDGESSIATFAASEMATTLELGDGRKVIESYVVESIEEGISQRIVFRCIVRPDDSGWVIETVELQAEEGESPSFAAIAD